METQIERRVVPLNNVNASVANGSQNGHIATVNSDGSKTYQPVMIVSQQSNSNDARNASEVTADVLGNGNANNERTNSESTNASTNANANANTNEMNGNRNENTSNSANDRSAEVPNDVVPPHEINMSVFFGIMRSEKERLFTFVQGKWPVVFIRKEALANAGFFYLMNGDRVQCAFCRGVICAWEPDDSPLVEHQRHFPRCPFILGYDVGNRPVNKDPIRDVRRGRDVCGGGHPRMQVATLEPEELLRRVYKVPSLANIDQFGVRIHKGAKNAKYVSFNARTLSFTKKWPKDVKCSVDTLAEAGFYYTGYSDCVKCFYCDGGVCDWNACRDPWTEHAMRYPDCDYLVLNKGVHFADSCAKLYSEEYLKHSKLSEANNAINDWMESKVVKDALAIHDYPKEAIRAVLKERWDKCHSNYENLGDLNTALISYLLLQKNEANKRSVEEVNEVKDRETLLSPEPQPMELCEPPSSSSSSSSSQSSLSSQSSPLSTSPTPSLRSIEHERLLCKTCLDNEVGVVFLPCGHLVTCTKCAPGVSTCPVCRTVIKGTVRTFLA